MVPVGACRRQFPEPITDVVAALQQIRAVSLEKQREHIGILQDQVCAVRLKLRQGAHRNLFRPTGDGYLLERYIRGVKSLREAPSNRAEAADGIEKPVDVDALWPGFQHGQELRTIRNRLPRTTCPALFAAEIRVMIVRGPHHPLRDHPGHIRIEKKISISVKIRRNIRPLLPNSNSTGFAEASQSSLALPKSDPMLIAALKVAGCHSLGDVGMEKQIGQLIEITRHRLRPERADDNRNQRPLPSAYNL